MKILSLLILLLLVGCADYPQKGDCVYIGYVDGQYKGEYIKWADLAHWVLVDGKVIAFTGYTTHITKCED